MRVTITLQVNFIKINYVLSHYVKGATMTHEAKKKKRMNKIEKEEDNVKEEIKLLFIHGSVQTYNIQYIYIG